MSEKVINPFLIPDLITEDGAAHELATSAAVQYLSRNRLASIGMSSLWSRSAGDLILLLLELDIRANRRRRTR
jgi:hypothetical protein